MTSTAIKKIDIRLFAVPLPEVLSDAKHGDHTHFELVTVTVTLENGCLGTGYTYTGGKGGRAIHATIKHDLAPVLIGKDGSAIMETYDFMEWHIHLNCRNSDTLIRMSEVSSADSFRKSIANEDRSSGGDP